MAITSIPLPPASGTITLTKDSPTVTGDGTGFKALDVGDLLLTGKSMVVIGEKPTANGSATLDIPFTGITETDVVYRVIPRALSSQAAYFFQLLNLNISSQEGQFVWLWSSATEASNPGAGKVQINNAAWASATALYLSDTDQQGNDLGAWLATWAGSKVGLSSLDRVGIVGKATVGTVTDSTGYRTIVLSDLILTPAFAEGERIAIYLMPAGAPGVDGDNAYVYTAYASDASGTDFTTTFDAALDYIAILSSTTAIASPVVGDFAGLWKNYKGAAGDAGANGSDGGGLKGISVRAASTTNIDLATALEAGDSAGGITLAAGNAFGAFGQTDASENGVYTVQATGSAVRHVSFDTWDKIAGGLFPAREGDNAGTSFQNTDAVGAGTIDVDNLTFIQQSGGVEGPVSATDNRVAVFDGATGGKIKDGGKTVAEILALIQPSGQCELTKSGSNLLLSRKNGRYIPINGALVEIPSSGPTLAPTSATPDTNYYIYAYMVSTTLTLEYSGTSPATDTTTGVQIKTGDATRTLVGFARPITGPAWVDSETQRFVLSWFNRKKKVAKRTASGALTTAESGYTSLAAGIIEFLTWGGWHLGTVNTSAKLSTSGSIHTQLLVDGSNTVASALVSVGAAEAGNWKPTSLAMEEEFAAGYHYADLQGKVDAGTGTWSNSVEYPQFAIAIDG